LYEYYLFAHVLHCLLSFNYFCIKRGMKQERRISRPLHSLPLSSNYHWCIFNIYKGRSRISHPLRS